MARLFFFGCSFLVTCCIGSQLRDAIAEDPGCADCKAAEMLPESVVAYANVPDFGAFVQTVMNHPLRSRIESLSAYDAIVKSGQMGQLDMAIDAFESSMKLPWQEAVSKLTDRGVTLVLDSSDGGAAILVHSSDPEALERFRTFLIVIRDLQGAVGKQGEYRGFVADSIGDKVKMVRLNDWFVLTNSSELGKSIVDQYLDQADANLANDDWFQEAQSDLANTDRPPRVASAIVDVETLRAKGVAREVFNEKVDNFFGELVLGGVLANVRHAAYATAAISMTDDGLGFELATPHQRDWEAPREYYFGEHSRGAAPPLLDVDQRLFALSTYRDLSQMWLRSGDLLSDRANDKLAVADTTLTTFFSGRDFGEDILGSFSSEVQIVGAVQDFTDVLPQPAIKLPAFAIQFRMKNPEETQPELRRVFQSFIGFLNVTGAQNGQPQLDLGMETLGAAQLVTATYVPDRDKRESLDEKIQFNFSPTVAFDGERMIVSSSTALARELVATEESELTKVRTQSNTFAEVDAESSALLLKANRKTLVANNMLEKGHPKEAAEAEIDLLTDLVSLFEGVSAKLDFSDSRMSLGLNVDVRAEAQP
ncbi:hypothetical protein [Rubripirellula amarantea]|uniref:hypothetical protein n=1 Tax=Rubripirellula amarantea TaxID=2527999 RepID=UPI0011B7EF1F|nr:hypothetical protein [Rubripirellula amarantea]